MEFTMLKTLPHLCSSIKVRDLVSHPHNTKNLKRITLPSPPLRTHLGTWANSNFDKARAFAHHLSEIFQPRPSENLPADDEAFKQLLTVSIPKNLLATS
jgi:hypothetical protein